MGETASGVRSDCRRQADREDRREVAEQPFHPRCGYFVESYDHQLHSHLQVWLRFRQDGVVVQNYSFWAEPYSVLNREEAQGRHTRYLLLAERIAQLLNAGMTVSELREAIGRLSEDMPQQQLPPGWFYWASNIESGPAESVCTHYFLQQSTRECLVWQEDTYVEIVPCEKVGISRYVTGLAQIVHAEDTDGKEIPIP